MSEESAPITTAEPDWNAIMVRYLAGDDHAAIAEEFGTTANAIRCRAHRHHWKDQQLKLIERNKTAISSEIRNCLVVSCLREARMFQRLDPTPAVECEIWSRIRERLVSTAARLLDWEGEEARKLESMKRASVIDI